MAAVAGTVWEYRATAGSDTNGGGFDEDSSGTDYSNQDDPELSFSAGELSTAGSGSTALTDDMMSGLFTSNMVGNYIYLETGMNLVDGRYRITAFTDSDNVTLDRAPDDGVDAVSGSDGYVGGALKKLSDAFMEDTAVVVAGNTFWIKDDGTMTMTTSVNVNTLHGTNLAPIKVIGYASTRGDDPTGSTRPLIACGANFHSYANYYHVSHLEYTTTNASGIGLGQNSRMTHCKSYNSSGTATRSAFTSSSSYVLYLNCDGKSDNGPAFTSGHSTRYRHCYAHDSEHGIFLSAKVSVLVSDCIIYNNTIGLYAQGTSSNGIMVLGNDFVSNTTNIEAQNASHVAWIVEDNIIDDATLGLDTPEVDLSWYVNHNVWDNTSDTNNVGKGPDAVTGDPALTNPATGNFTVGAGSNVINKASRILVDGITV